MPTACYYTACSCTWYPIIIIIIIIIVVANTQTWDSRKPDTLVHAGAEAWRIFHVNTVRPNYIHIYSWLVRSPRRLLLISYTAGALKTSLYTAENASEHSEIIPHWLRAIRFTFVNLNRTICRRLELLLNVIVQSVRYDDDTQHSSSAAPGIYYAPTSVIKHVYTHIGSRRQKRN